MENIAGKISKKTEELVNKLKRLWSKTNVPTTSIQKDPNTGTEESVNKLFSITCGEGLTYYDPRKIIDDEVRNALYEQVDMCGYIGDTTWRAIIKLYHIDESFAREFIEFLSLRQWHQLDPFSIDFERELKSNFNFDLEAERQLYILGSHGICI